VNDRFGEFADTFGSVLDKVKKEGEQGKPEGLSVISPAWRPEGIRKVDVE
jgi:DNA polymerase-4